MGSPRVNAAIAAQAVSVSGLARFLRTAFQLVLALGAAIPTILLTPAVSGNAEVVKILGTVSGYIVIIVGIVNALEQGGIIPTFGGKAATPLGLTVTRTPLSVPEGQIKQQ